jgi:hypothetical protein
MFRETMDEFTVAITKARAQSGRPGHGTNRVASGKGPETNCHTLDQAARGPAPSQANLALTDTDPLAVLERRGSATNAGQRRQRFNE